MMSCVRQSSPIGCLISSVSQSWALLPAWRFQNKRRCQSPFGARSWFMSLRWPVLCSPLLVEARYPFLFSVSSFVQLIPFAAVFSPSSRGKIFSLPQKSDICNSVSPIQPSQYYVTYFLAKLVVFWKGSSHVTSKEKMGQYTFISPFTLCWDTNPIHAFFQMLWSKQWSSLKTDDGPKTILPDLGTGVPGGTVSPYRSVGGVTQDTIWHQVFVPHMIAIRITMHFIHSAFFFRQQCSSIICRPQQYVQSVSGRIRDHHRSLVRFYGNDTSGH